MITEPGMIRPARRGAPRSLARWLAAALLLICSVEAQAHGDADHDHGPPAAAVAGSRPRIAVQSEAYQLVGVLDRGQLTVYLDRFADNAPVTGATIEVTIGDEPVAAERNAEGTYAVKSKRLETAGEVEMVFAITAPEGDDLLIGQLAIPTPQTPHAAASSAAFLEPARHALGHLTDHPILLGATLFVGLALGLALRRRRHAYATVLAIAAVLALADHAQAHEGHDHAEQSKALAATGDTAQRLPGGQVFVPKPMQRILDVRTTVAKPETAAKAVVLIGRVITNPNRSGLVQSINGGRVVAPAQGLPRLGQSVRKSEVLATIEAPLPIADRTTISERSGEIEQMIAVAETKLRRLRGLAERGVTPQTQVVDAETELDGLRRRREIIREVRVTPEVLHAPVDGVIAAARIVAGQVVQAQDVLFQIVDPANLWVEAYVYGDFDPSTLREATAAGADGKPMKVEFQGFSRALQQQATVVQFAIADPPGSIRVGQPITVTAKRNDSITGVIVSRDAVVRGGNGEPIVWRHVEPERFEARPVRTEPFDAASVVIAAGVGDGDRIVIRGAELINQIR